MNEPSRKDDDLERLLHGVLRELPPRRAPESLQAQVLGELQRRAALPWWRQSFNHWPALARSGFLFVCAALIIGTVLGGAWAMAGMRSVAELGAMALAWAQPALSLLADGGGLVSLLIHAIPPFWLYGAVCVGAAFYVTLFGLGAAAYRTLYLRPATDR